jgi:hypothetical protein
MVQILGNAGSGNTYNAPPPDLPHDTTRLRPAHKPWCADCKRKDRELNVDDLCATCAHARVTRAALQARWAEAEKQEAAEARRQEAAARSTAAERRMSAPVVSRNRLEEAVRRVSRSLAIKQWALNHGLVDEIRPGRLPHELAAAYEAARARGEVA